MTSDIAIPIAASELRRIVPVTFHAAQARQRRQIWRTTVICLIAAIIAGIFLSVVTLLFAPVTLGIVAGLAVRIIQALGLNAPALEAGYAIVTGPGRNAAIATVAALIILPALLPPPLAWMWLRALMRRAQPTPWPPGLAVRPPRIGDAEERQFANLVEEMALAAGLAAPAVGLIDDSTANIAAFGTDHEHAGIAATRGLLDTLDRAETQMLVAQLTGAIGNGDLRVAGSLQAVYRAIGLFMTLIDLPLRRDARRAVATLIAASFGRPPAERLDAAFAVLDDQLAARNSLKRLLLWLPAMLVVPGVTFWAVADKFNVDKDAPWGAVVPALMLFAGAAILFYGLVRLTLGIWTIFVLNWPLALSWRSRRFLGDATAVQLAGDPQALADALAHLRGVCGIPAGGERFAHLFVCQPEATVVTAPLTRLEPSFAIRSERLRALGATQGSRPQADAAVVVGRIQQKDTTRLGITAVFVFFLIVNYRLTGLIIAVGLAALLALSTGAGLLLFMTIVNA